MYVFQSSIGLLTPTLCPNECVIGRNDNPYLKGLREKVSLGENHGLTKFNHEPVNGVFSE